MSQTGSEATLSACMAVACGAGFNDVFLLFFFFFFFQAEDGIRDYDVTGVQTCALPILYSNFSNDVYYLMQSLYGGRAPDLKISMSGKQGQKIGRASCRERV